MEECLVLSLKLRYPALPLRWPRSQWLTPAVGAGSDVLVVRAIVSCLLASARGSWKSRHKKRRVLSPCGSARDSSCSLPPFVPCPPFACALTVAWLPSHSCHPCLCGIVHFGPPACHKSEQEPKGCTFRQETHQQRNMNQINLARTKHALCCSCSCLLPVFVFVFVFGLVFVRVAYGRRWWPS